MTHYSYDSMDKDRSEPRDGLSARQEANYRRALRRYIKWQGRDPPFLAYEICLYLVECYGDGKIGIDTTLAAISNWHKTNGFPDPTQCPLVVELAQDIKRWLSPKYRSALQLPPSIVNIMHLAEAHELSLSTDSVKSFFPSQCIAYRNKAILLIGFWFGLTTAEVCRLTIRDIKITHTSLEIITSRVARGGARYSFEISRLPLLCPLAALEDWLSHPGIAGQYLFPRTTRRVLPGPVSSRVVQDSLNKLMAAQNVPPFNIKSLRYSLYFFLAENGWSRQKILNHLPFYTRHASKTRLGKTARDIPSAQASSGIPPETMSEITSILENSRYNPA